MENNNFNIELKQGEYFNYGQHYFVEFKYGTKEQQNKMYELFKKAFIPSYGFKSQRANHGQEYIMPYFADENGVMTPNDTGKIGGTSIPEDLLPEFIRRFVEVDKAVVKVGEQQIKDNFDYEAFNDMVEQLGLRIELKQGEYFDYGQHYFVEFKYGTKEQQNEMYELFEKAFIPSYGSKSQRANHGQEYIMPYFVDENGVMTPNDTGKIGGTSIPEDLLPEFIRRFVEVDKAVVKVGEQQIKDSFDYEAFNDMVQRTGVKKRLKYYSC